MDITCVVRLTPSGRGAVAVVRLAGPDARRVLLKRFQSRSQPDVDKPVFGKFRLRNSEHHEEAVIRSLKTDDFEICVHGGEAVVAAVEASLIDEGAVAVPWAEFLYGGESQQERAARLLPFAKTERTARILLDQIRLNAPSDAVSEFDELGKHLVEPFRVVLAGGTNAGKSSLLNAILGFQRSIVDQTPGTTRDVVEVETAIDGFPFLFCDTAGFRATDCEIERQGIQRSSQWLKDADLVLWIIDLSVAGNEQPPIPTDRNTLFVYNKSDLPRCCEPLANQPPIFTSAETGEGIDVLLRNVLDRLIPKRPGPSDFVRLSCFTRG